MARRDSNALTTAGNADPTGAEPLISIQLLIHIARWLETRDFAIGDLLGSVGVPDSWLADPQQLLPLRSYVAFLEGAAELARMPHLGLALARFADVDSLGALGHLFINAPSLLDAFESFTSRLGALQEGTTNRLLLADDTVQIDYRIDDNTILSRRQDTEYSIAASANLAHLYSKGTVRPREVWFEHSRAGDYRTYRDHFGCDVFFEQPSNKLIFDRKGFNVHGMGHSVLSPIIAAHLDQLIQERDAAEDFVARVQRLIEQGLSTGVVSEEAVAQSLGFSTATLGRRLRRERRSFRAMVMAERLAIAQRMLLSEDRSIGEVAQAAGYGENSSLTRAFRKAHGVSPAAFRRAHRLQSAQPQRA